MTKRCTFKNTPGKKWHCGSYAFNLLRDGIEQGPYCDTHYWQDKAEKAALEEREQCAQLCTGKAGTSGYDASTALYLAEDIRARSQP